MTRALFITCVLLASPAALAGARHALLVASPLGDADEKALRWADANVARMRDVLVDLGGFAPADVTVLSRATADDVRKAAIAINERIRGAPAADSMFLVYYSGHADAGALHLGGTHLDLDDVRGLVRGSAAAFRLLIVDACRSGTITAVKGVQRAATSFAIDVDPGHGREGVVLLTSAAAGEDAQESDAIRGSFFTHALVSGLVGAADANRDGAVSLEEAYRYAYNATLRASSRTISGPQHPTFQYDFRGRGDLVLTRVDHNDARRGFLTLPAGVGFLIMRDGSDGDVVAEIDPSTNARALSLRAGRYFVRGRARDALYEGNVDVAAARSVTVDLRALERTTYARLVRKGGSERESASSTLGGYFVRSSILGHSPCHGLAAAYALDYALFSISPRLSVCGSGFTNAVVKADVREASASIRVATALDLPASTLDFGVLAGGGALSQSFVTRGEAAARVSAMAFFGIGASAAVELPLAFYLFGEADGRAYVLSVAGADDTSAIQPQLAVASLIGIGKRF